MWKRFCAEKLHLLSSFSSVVFHYMLAIGHCQNSIYFASENKFLLAVCRFLALYNSQKFQLGHHAWYNFKQNHFYNYVTFTRK